MKLINWSGIKDAHSLIKSLITFLKKVFKTKLEGEEDSVIEAISLQKAMKIYTYYVRGYQTSSYLNSR